MVNPNDNSYTNKLTFYLSKLLFARFDNFCLKKNAGVCLLAQLEATNTSPAVLLLLLHHTS